MHSKALTHNPFAALASTAQRPKRIDLVVTDCDFAADMAGRNDTGGMQQEFRCTIPLAILRGDITGDVLRAVAHFCRQWMDSPISAEDLLRLVERLCGSLKETADSEPAAGHSRTDPDDEMRIARLTPRELEVLEHVVAGNPNKCTAAALNISRRTVEHHRAVIMHKTRTKSVPELVRLTLRTHLFAEGQMSHV